MAYTIPSDAHAIGDANHTVDHNNIIDVLVGTGTVFNVLNTAYAGGADRTGVTDSTAAFNAALIAAAAAAGPGGAMVYAPHGSYMVSNLLIDSYVTLKGDGPSTVLTGKTGATGYMLALKTHATTQQVVVRDLTLNGQFVASLGGVQLDSTGFGTSSSPTHEMMNVHVVNITGDGFHFDNNARGMRLTNCWALNAGGNGFYLGVGCTDSHFLACGAGPATGHTWNIAGWNNMFAACKGFFAGFNGSVFSTTQACFYLSSCQNNTFVGCSAQNAALHGFDLQSAVNCTITGCESDGNNKGGAAGVGINTNTCISCSIVGNTGSNVGADPQAYGLQVAGTQTGTTFIGNTLSGTGGTLNYVSGSGYFYVGADAADFSALPFFRVPTLILTPAGAQALSNGSTISGTSANSALPVTATGAVTGIILQAPSFGWSRVTVVNQSAFTLTFAAAGTSNVADGVLDVIPALAARTFTYDSNTSLWYRAG